MDIFGAAQVTSIAGVLGDNPGSNATVHVGGAGSSWTMTQRLDVGNQGSALLTISDATVSNTQGTLGVSGSMSSGEVFVSGGRLPLSDVRWCRQESVFPDEGVVAPA